MTRSARPSATEVATLVPRRRVPVHRAVRVGRPTAVKAHGYLWGGRYEGLCVEHRTLVWVVVAADADEARKRAEGGGPVNRFLKL